MRIVFLCGSLEPGHDGVGDYTRKLAFEVIRQGQLAIVIALNDPYIKIVTTDLLRIDEVYLQTLRLPKNLSFRETIKHARDKIEKFNPDVLSLQFVPYSFNSKGLPLAYIYKFVMIVGKYKLQIMFHETWIEVHKTGNLKSILLATMQKIIILFLINILKPVIIHTSIPRNKLRLHKLGWSSEPLPLFSNVSVNHEFNVVKDSSLFVIGFFSQVGINPSIILFLSKLIDQAESRSFKIKILIIGGKIKKIEREIKLLLENIYSLNEKIEYLGFLDEKELSWAIQKCDIGLTPVPRHLLGKSGSVAAFLTHSIPVAAPNVMINNSLSEIGFFSDALVKSILTEPDFKILDQLHSRVYDVASIVSLPTVAKIFVSSIAKISKSSCSL